MKHYINTAAVDSAKARTVGATQLTPAPFPVLAYGDGITQDFFFFDDGTIESWSGDASNGLRVTLGNVNAGPFGGTYTLTCGETTEAISYNANQGTIQNALNTLATVISEGYVDVTGDFPNFLVTWRTTGSKTSLTVAASNLIPISGAAVTVLQAASGSATQRVALTFRQNAIDSTTSWTPITSPYAGWEGTLSTNTAAALSLLVSAGVRVNEFVQVVTVLLVERITPTATYQTVFEAPVTLRAKNVDLGATGSASFPNSLLLAVQNRPSITGLASASANAVKLAGQATASSALPAGAVFCLNLAVSIVNDDSSTTAGILTLLYQLQAGTTATAAPLTYRPYDYNASTNAVFWQLLGAWLGVQPAAYNAVTGKFHRNYVYGSANACAVSCDQIGTSAPA